MTGQLAHPVQCPRQKPLTIALVVGLLLFAPLYLAALLPLRLAPAPLVLVLLYPPSLLFADLARYGLVSLVGVGLALGALVRGNLTRTQHGLCLLLLLAIVALPWVYRYQPPVAVVSGYTLREVTTAGRWEGVVKRSQAFAELHPCAYDLLGWGRDNTLFFTEHCQGSKPQWWTYHPARDEAPRRVEPALENLSIGAEVGVLDKVYLPTYFPPQDEPNARRSSVTLPALVSPNGQWVAFVARYLYGLEHVLLVSAEVRAASQGGVWRHKDNTP